MKLYPIGPRRKACKKRIPCECCNEADQLECYLDDVKYWEQLAKEGKLVEAIREI